MRARVYQMQKKTDEAKADVEAALKNNPDLPAAIEMRALIAASSGDLGQAIKDLKELIKLAPDSTDLVLQLAIFHSSRQAAEQSD